MRMIRYQGSSTQEVMNRVRRELGPHALIVSTEEEGGVVHMVAAIDRHLQPLCAQETFSEIKKCLIHHRTPRPVIDHLMNNPNLEGSMPEVLSRLLRGTLHVPPLSTILNDGAPIMLIGPPGVGKTLALVKLAAQCLMENRPMQIFSTDRQKSGACAQIESLSEALGASLSVIENPTLLHRAVEAHKAKDLLLIDTPGTNPFDEGERERLHKLVHAAQATVVLVMPTRGDHEYCDEMEVAFKDFDVKYLILTQLDLTPRLGHVITRALDSHYPLVAVGHMPEVAHLLVPTTSFGFTNLFIERFDNHVQQSMVQPKLRSAC
jgi:flagellar biosynthesis protein FlhF